jgi:succinoglycan biosynthesis transport protein ExoP
MRATGLPLLGLISRIGDEADGEPYVAHQARSPVAEAFGSLRTNLHFSAVDRPLRTLPVTSAGPQEGKSTVAINLAVVMAQGGHRVTLIDADLRRPRLHRLLGVPNRIGLSDLFTRNPLDFDGAVQACRMENVSLLASGGLPPNPAVQVVEQLRRAGAKVVGLVFNSVALGRSGYYNG